jgi:hypothetical protein
MSTPPTSHALSGMDGWRDVAGLMVIGRTLPAPATVETITTALTNRTPSAATEEETWWYGAADREIDLTDGNICAMPGEVHGDAMVEAVRWSVCEGELIQAIGRGGGVNLHGGDAARDRPAHRRRPAGRIRSTKSCPGRMSGPPGTT